MFKNIPPGGQVIPNVDFGTGTGPILVSNISCNGTEYDLYECYNTTIIPGTCTHDLDAALSCQAGFSMFSVLIIIENLYSTCHTCCVVCTEKSYHHPFWFISSRSSIDHAIRIYSTNCCTVWLVSNLCCLLSQLT